MPGQATATTHSALSEWPRIAEAKAGTVLLQTARPDAENGASYLFRDPVAVLAAHSLDEIPAVFAAAEKALQEGCYVAGLVSYEAGYHFEPKTCGAGEAIVDPDLPLVWFGVYRAPELCAAGELGIEEDTPAEELDVAISVEEYRAAIARIRAYIAAGDFYQANFTIPLRQTWRGGAAALFERMMLNQPVAYGALINTGDVQVLSASPELFFRRSGDSIVVRPMKGTAPRGRDVREDARSAAWLAADEKNRAENVMIVDLLRNDLGRICKPGSVRVSELFAVERYPGLLQMTSTIRGELNPGTTTYGIFRSLFPCGSITGAPKIRTMQAIRELERGARGIACGAIGFLAPGGDAVFNVAIRTAMLRGNDLELRVGSGVTYGSDADAEYAECMLKARFLTRARTKFQLIETMLWRGGYFLLDLHLERLAESAAYFDFRFDEQIARDALSSFALKLPEDAQHRVRLLLARSGDISIASEPIAQSASATALRAAAERTDSTDVFLRHKTTQRGFYDRELAAARAAGYDDALFLNERGEVTECAIHNIMILKDGCWLTPAIEGGLLPGVYRRWLLERHAEIREAVLTLADLRAARRVFLFNSVRGLRRVRRIDGL